MKKVFSMIADIKKMADHVQIGHSGEAGVGHSEGGGGGKLGATDQVGCGVFRVGSIRFSAFGGLHVVTDEPSVLLPI